MAATKADLIRKSKEYLDAVHLGLDPVEKEPLPAWSVGMDRAVREACGEASVQLGYALANKAGRNRRPGGIDELYDCMSVVEALGAGRDPVTGGAVRPDDPMGSLRVRRGMAFAASVLDESFDKLRGKDRASFRMPADAAAEIRPLPEAVTVTGVVKNINQHNPDPERVDSLGSQGLNDWLESEGILSPRRDKGAIRLPSEKGLAMGMSVETRMNKDGRPYDGVLFPPEVQQFVADNLDRVSAFLRDAKQGREAGRERAARAARKEAAVRKAMDRGRQAERRLGSPAREADGGLEYD